MNAEQELETIRTVVNAFAEGQFGVLELPPDTCEHSPLTRSLCNELADVAMLISHCTEVYCHFSGGRISKPNTLPAEVVAVAEELENERVDREVKEALELAHSQLDAAGVPRCIRIDDNVVDFDLTDRIEILGLRASMVHGIASARDLARRIALCLHPTPANMSPDETKRETVQLTILPMIDRAFHKIVAAAKEEARAGL